MKKIIYIGKSKFGKGVFASCDIKKGEIICKLKGRIVKTKDLWKEHSRGRNSLIDPLQIAPGKYLIYDKKYLTINHSCSPNTGIIKRLKLFAIKNIKKDD